MTPDRLPLGSFCAAKRALQAWLLGRRSRPVGLGMLIAVGVLALLVLVSHSIVRAQSAVVTLLSPVDGTVTTVGNYPPLAIPLFEWQAVAGATKYRIQCSQDPGFSSTPLNVTTANPSYIPTNASTFADGTWYWRVRVESPSPPGDYSEIWVFTKQWASLSNAPVLSAPDDGAALVFYDLPAFTWKPVMGAARYRFQIATSPDGFGSPILNQITLAPVYQPTAKEANGIFYWRILPLDPADHAGMPSEVWQFTSAYVEAPVLLEPADNSEPTLTPSFRWTAVRGAEFYRLQYSTDPSFQSGVTTVDTRSTAYTPVNALPNDVNYYWRVRVESGDSVSDWSHPGDPWTFVKKWYMQPELLTPVGNAQNVGSPFFSWTPVPGANRYKIEVSPSNSFPPPGGGFTEYTANTCFVKPSHNWTSSTTWYWRVTPQDHKNHAGLPSTVSSFDYDADALTPQLISPLYYYDADNYAADDPGLAYLALLEPREDRTVALPVFTWQRLLTSSVPSNAEVAAYRLQVDDDPLFGSPQWTWETENLSAAPTADLPFVPATGVDYYWRVRALDGLGGNPVDGWSQRWKSRIDTDLGLPPTSEPAPILLRPASGTEAVELTPMLEWWPKEGADSYDVQISTDPIDFEGYITHTATALYPAYAPPVRLGFGTYYWRVRGHSDGQPLGEWSTPWRFQVAAQSRWRLTRTIGDPGNRLEIGSDPAGDMTDPNYDVTALYAAESNPTWFFGFDVTADPATDMTYALYLDLDHQEDSGGSTDPAGYGVAAISVHRPEYAIYIYQIAGAFDAEHVILYGWTGNGWGIPDTLASVGGALHAESGYVELQIPNTAIGMQDDTGSAAVSLFSAMASGGHAQDTVPSDPNVSYAEPDPGPGTTTLSRFTSVSNRLNLATPPSNATGDSTVFPSVPALFFQLPVDTPWVGFNVQVAVDEQFSDPLLDYSVQSGSYVAPIYTRHEDFDGDNTYFWRLRPLHTTTPLRGAWTQPSRFERSGFVPQNLQTSVRFATPTFSWSRMEGAKSYDLQVDDDPSFGSPALAVNDIGQDSHTPVNTLAPGTYYWHVRARRYDGITNDWSASQVFVLDLPVPTGLSTDPPGVVPRAPTLCWTPVLTPTVEPLLAAWKYRVEVSKSPTFSEIYDTADTEQACWTPTKGYGDLTNYYWHVAMRDGNNRQGSYSTAAAFSKQYPTATLLSPLGGIPISETPTFSWTPVDGAASYRLEVSEHENFGTLYDSVTTNNTFYRPIKRYEISRQYWWRVAIIDKNGNYGPFSTTMLTARVVFLPLAVRND